MEKKPKQIQSSKELLSKYDFVSRLAEQAKFIATEHQDYGLRLAYKLGDPEHRTLYMKLARDLSRNLMEAAASFAIDYPDKKGDGNKGRIFMWKLKQLCVEKNVKIPSGSRRISKHKQYLKKQIKLL